jgi:penicillin amidase
MMAWNLGGNQQLELLRMRLQQVLGPERATDLFPVFPLPPPQAWMPSAETGDALLSLGDRLNGLLRLGGYDVGSNAWVVDGAHSRSGYPMLANDPHLGAQLPSQWHLIELRGDRLHVTGASLVGLPLVLLGRNRHVAWGMTNLGADVQDWVVEQFDPLDATRYRVAEGWRRVTAREERIEVRGRDEPEIWLARETHHGPLLSDVTGDRALGALGGHAPSALALRWTALDEEDRTIAAVVALNRAAEGEAVDRALRDWVAPPVNIVWADDRGATGYRAPGRIPMRERGTGMLPRAGWQEQHDWQGFVPFDALPAQRNPRSGFIVTANQEPATDGAHFLGSDFAPPLRAARIERALREGIGAGAGLDPADMRAIQLDRGSDMVDSLLPILTRLEPDPRDDRQAAALDILEGWDGINRPDDVAPSILHAWQRQLLIALVEDDLGKEEGMDWRTAEGLNRRQSVFVLQLLGAGLSGSPEPERGGSDGLADARGWCDDQRTLPVESCAQLARRALTAALDELESLRGPSMSRWPWGAVHRTQLAQAPLSEVALLRPLFHRSLPAGGDAFSPNAGPVNWAQPYDHTHLPGYRQIVTMRPWAMRSAAAADSGAAPHRDPIIAGAATNPTDRFVIAGGQSGHPASSHYDDLLELHAAGEDIPMTMGREAIQGPTRSMRLLP